MPAASGAVLSTVTVDLAASAGPFPYGLGRQLSDPAQRNYGPETYARLEALQLQRVRVWPRFTHGWDTGTGTPAYANQHSYLDTYHARAGTLPVNWRTDHDPLATGRTWTGAPLFAATREMPGHTSSGIPHAQPLPPRPNQLRLLVLTPTSAPAGAPGTEAAASHRPHRSSSIPICPIGVFWGQRRWGR